MNPWPISPGPGSVIIRFNLDSILRADFKGRQEGLQIQRQNGAINADEWREIEGRNPIGGTKGETYLRPSNMVPADTPGTIAKDQSPQEPKR